MSTIVFLEEVQYLRYKCKWCASGWYWTINNDNSLSKIKQH